MSKFYAALTPELRDFIGQQHLFFTATAAPGEGRINLSPKGMDTFRCLDEHTVAYLDLTGSGNEAAAHLAADGRMTMMFCSFDTKPLILRLYGHGVVVALNSERGKELHTRFPTLPGQRHFIVLHVESVQTSCGFAVPFYDFKSERDTLVRWAESKGEDGVEAYRREKNVRSIDGLPTGTEG